MIVISGHNVNDAFYEASWKLATFGVEADSRNGKVLSIPYPVVIEYRHPCQRMLADPLRDANPFFHVMEAMWMLCGQNDLETISPYNSNMAQFSDDGVTLNGAYGYRWRYHFDIDQIEWVIGHLRENKNSRRAVITMWDACNDPISVCNESKDVPCNTTIYFRIVNNKVNMTVLNRSNDAVWGAFGANVVHMSFLHEYVALALGIDIGTYWQITNNLHMYERHFELLRRSSHFDIYTCEVLSGHMGLLEGSENTKHFLFELNDFLTGEATLFDYSSRYISKVLIPLATAWEFHKVGDTKQAIHVANGIGDEAVKTVCKLWLGRRLFRKEV